MNDMFARLAQGLGLAQFHFLRPLWLLAIIPAFALAVLLWARKSSGANWRATIAPELIDYLLETAQQMRPQWPWLALAGWLLAIVALAGPTWEKLPQPVLQKRDGLVIVLDMSLSMYAEDIKPSRLERERFKTIDILQQRREGLTGLVVYSGDAHVVSPLTDDVGTIENLVPALSPAIMPSFGSNAVAGIDTAIQLLRNSGFEHGRILLLTDDIADDDAEKIAALIDGKQWQLGVIGIGTEQGAPIPLPRNASQGGFLKQNDGTIAIAQLHRDRLLELAKKANGHYDDLRIDDSDIAATLPPIAIRDDSVRTLEREFDRWRERGPQLVMLLLPLAAFAFRRGWLLMVFLIPFSTPSHALEWRDFWLRPDQQAQRDFNAGNSKAASQKFQDQNWRAAAQYRSGDFAQAANSLQSIDTADAQYNRGNALAQEGKLQDAITAYDAALKKDPAHADAKANRDLVEKLLKQQQKNQQSDAQQQKPQNDQRQNNAQQNSPSQQSQSQQNQSKNGQGQQHQPQSGNERLTDQKQSGTQENAQKNSPQEHQRANAAADKNQQNPNNSAAPQAATDDRQQKDTASKDQAAADGEQQKRSQQPKDSQQAAIDKLSPEQERQQRATEQWLRQIPDDPSGLLRRKFLYENQQREQSQQDNGKPLW